MNIYGFAVGKKRWNLGELWSYIFSYRERGIQPVNLVGRDYGMAQNPNLGLVLAGGTLQRVADRSLRKVFSTLDGIVWDSSSVADLPIAVSHPCLVNVDDRTLVSIGGMLRHNGSYIKEAYTCQVGGGRQVIESLTEMIATVTSFIVPGKYSPQCRSPGVAWPVDWH